MRSRSGDAMGAQLTSFTPHFHKEANQAPGGWQLVLLVCVNTWKLCKHRNEAPVKQLKL